MRTFRTIAFLCLLTTIALAQFHPSNLRRTPNQASNTVRDYLRLDLDGARLTSESWPRIKALTTWKENPDWQAFTIVSHYDVVSANQGSRSAVVTVNYAVLGRFQVGIGYSRDPGPERVEFTVRELEDGWRIEEQAPTLNPHISRARALRWLQAALAAEKDPGSKIAIEKALQTLQPN